MSKYCLVGQDGNAFNVIGYTARALRREGLGNLCAEMQEKATSGDYSHLICVCDEYLDMANEKAKENGWFDEDDDEDE